MKKLLNADNPISIIGTRHGDKLYKTLLTREEMAVAQDLEGYFRVPADNRDLNYSQYFSEGSEEVALKLDYNSHNTDQKDVDGMCELLLKLWNMCRCLCVVRRWMFEPRISLINTNNERFILTTKGTKNLKVNART